MIIYFMKHGKDDEDYRGGWSDLPLVEEGVTEVIRLSEYLFKHKKEFNIGKVISSDLTRTKQTTEIINKKLNVPVEYTKRLREINNGEIAGMLNSEAELKYPGLYYNTLEIDEKYPGGESPIGFYNRVINGFEEIIKENKEITNLIIVTHTGVIDIVYKYINNKVWSNKLKPIKVSSAGIYSLKIDGKERRFELENFKV